MQTAQGVPSASAERAGTAKGQEFANRFGLPTATALVFWALAGTGYQAVYYGIIAFFLGVPVYIWMKAQRKEYGESPVIPIAYPAGSPYAAAAAGQGTGPAGQGTGNGTAGQAPAASARQAAGHGVRS
jgi:hypothetical protein